MFRKLMTIVVLLFATFYWAYGQSGALRGKVIDSETGEPVPFANIVVEAGGSQAGGATSDFEGNFTIRPLSPGRYDVKASFVGYKPLMIRGVIINADQVRFMDIEMDPTAETLETFEVKDYRVPLIDKDQTTSGETVTREDIAKLPGRSATAVAATVGGVFSQDGEMGSIRGARSEGTVMYIDGVRVRGTSSVPQSALEQVSVITGGTPAQYGDATGGIVNITTRGPSRKFGAGGELITSQFLDNWGYNMLGFNVQGPLLRDKETERSLLGFMLTGELMYREDPRPFAIPYHQASDERIEYLENNPFRPSGTGFGAFYNSTFTRMEDLEATKTKQYAESYSINLNAKIDVGLDVNTNLTFGGSMHHRGGYNWSMANAMFNAENNGVYEDNTYRFYGRFTQRFPTDRDSPSLIRDVNYTIQADFSHYDRVLQDRDHQENLFNYGYIGNYKTHKIPSFERGSDTILGFTDVWIHNGFRDTLIEFTPGDINRKIAAYTSDYYEFYDLHSGMYANKVLIRQGQGLLNGMTPQSVYGLYTNVGAPYGSYQKIQNQQYSVNASGSAGIGNHEIRFGLMYEQRMDRAISYNAVGLWRLMDQVANRHIAQLDLNNPIPVYDAYGVFQDTVLYDRLYDEGFQSAFDAAVREKLGLPVDGLDWIDVDNLDPSFYTIDMFSADELLNAGDQYVNYYGYDHTGEVYGTRPSFEDFFTATDENGNFTRPIAPFEPIYMAGYIQDRFTFDDLVFNIGVRVDRYDANQKVLKDPFLLYEAKTVGEVDDLGPHPGNMGDDYVVYVDDYNNPNAILGYRSGMDWYDARGTSVQNPSVLESGTGINPYLVNPDQTAINATAFEDYDPQVTVMPRISFSFPISREALFFAHYDVLTKRPTSGARLDILDYYFIESRGQSTLNNPNLRPERTTDYEVGFQQVLGPTSSLKLSAYYREMRDMVQAFPYTGAYPVPYISYSNLDFGTVKGLTVAYDLRRTRNMRLRANYTLQFADGTGSSATTSLSLIRAGQPNLRTTNPLSFDRRHAINVVADYRFRGGTDYDGPSFSRTVVDEDGERRVRTYRILENTGINLTMRGGSGTPYTAHSRIYSAVLGGGAQLIDGSIGGSRLPWSFSMDARIDRNIQLGDEGRTHLNVYVTVLNVLDNKNVLNVYNATGSPDDDGFLSAPEFQQQIESQNDPQAFRDLYTTRIQSPYNYSLPRRIRLGVAFNF